MRSLYRFILPFFILAGIAVLIGLGTWQMQRLTWKEALIAKVEERLARDPVPLETLWRDFSKALVSVMPDASKDGIDIEYAPTTVTGTFRHEGEQHFFATHEGKSGWYIFTPLIWNTKDGDETVVLVNRGFVPLELKDPGTRPQGQVKEQVTINGLARQSISQKPNSFVPDNNIAKNEFFWKDWDAMIVNAGFGEAPSRVPFFIDADDAANPGGWPKGGVTLIQFPNSHLQYAFTWYGLALALAFVGIAFMRSRRKNKAGTQAALS